MLELCAGTGKHRVELKIWDTGNGWVGSLVGGEAPHVGGVVLAAPRPSLTGQGASCDLWLIPVPGHLDNDVAAPLAKELCSRLGVPVSLAAGIHIDRAGAEDIAQIRANCEAVGREFFVRLQMEADGS